MATPIPSNQARVSAWQIAAASGGRVTREVDATLVGRGVTTDSRAVAPGSVFVALRGERFDGHEFVARAEESGAAIVVVARGESARARTAAVVEVDDTLLAWGAIARLHLAAWRRSAPADAPRRVIAITGSAGKTTTKELVRALASEVAPCHATAGNLNNRVGLPSVVLGLEPHHRIAVLEMGMSVPGEIAAMAEIAPPDVAIVTNVGLAHAGGVGGTRS
ncbi:MAG: UDP-N-acetylmuramoylalanyl-D-glutamyl-2, 6-diaminopimelate--D-alanyl-D-alanine ligase, partial [Myxococcales bacterium]|nr:UDP-N-acetylmuramoylalanyl-D-glutamyl-2, 6-diaminopimelate--D-alanyl-D-alanine ligase [Myxococcales bacterium]